jgi:hypothetical protein
MLSLPWKVFFRKVPSGMKNRIANANTSFVFLNLPHASQKLYALEWVVVLPPTCSGASAWRIDHTELMYNIWTFGFLAQMPETHSITF